MSEKNINEETSYHEKDEAELRRLESRVETGADVNTIQTVEIVETEKRKRNLPAWIIALSIVAVVGLLSFLFIWSKQSASKGTEVSVHTEKKDEHGEDEHKEGEAKEVKLEAEALESAGI
jgi:type VI protein secretion system component VasK